MRKVVGGVVVDPFHIVRLGNQALIQCRQRVQQATQHHRGWKDDPLYDIRKLLLMGAEHIDDRAWARIHEGLRIGDPHDSVQAAWCAKELVRDVYLTGDPVEASVAPNEAIAWCNDPKASPELVTLEKTLTKWKTEILNHHTTGASNGTTEAANLHDQDRETQRTWFQEPGQLPSPHPPRWRPNARDSNRHKIESPSQVYRGGPLCQCRNPQRQAITL